MQLNLIREAFSCESKGLTVEKKKNRESQEENGEKEERANNKSSVRGGGGGKEGEKTLSRTRGRVGGVRRGTVAPPRQEAAEKRRQGVCREGPPCVGGVRKKRRGAGEVERGRREGRRWSSWYRPAEKGVDFSTPGRRTSVRGTCSGLDYG